MNIGIPRVVGVGVEGITNHWALESERNQPRPTFPESLFVSLRFEDTGDGIINSFLLPFTPDDITVIAIVPHHLLTSVRYVRTHGGEPFHSRENLDGLPVFRRIDDHQNVTVGIKSEEVAKTLNSNDYAGDGVVLMDCLLEKDLQGFPGTTA